MATVAFVSCADVVDDADQVSWTRMGAHNPDCLVLLGDNIYMDWGKFGKRKLNAPRDWDDNQFAQKMYELYKEQWEVASFQRAVRAIPQVYAIWDDHDFAWNNSYGANGVGSRQDKGFVWPERRKISRALFEQFRTALATKAAQYPPYPFPGGFSQLRDLGSIYQMVDIASDVRLFLTDGRTYRVPNRELLGQQQRSQIQGQLLNPPAVNLVASGSTVQDNDSGWKLFQDWAWLKGLGASHNILVLSGDIHTLQWNSGSQYGRIFEAVSSGIARPPGITRVAGKTTDNYATMHIDQSQIIVELWRGSARIQGHRIDRQTWREL